MRTELPTATAGGVKKVLSARWRALPTAQRAPFITTAAAERAAAAAAKASNPSPTPVSAACTAAPPLPAQFVSAPTAQAHAHVPALQPAAQERPLGAAGAAASSAWPGSGLQASSGLSAADAAPGAAHPPAPNALQAPQLAPPLWGLGPGAYPASPGFNAYASMPDAGVRTAAAGGNAQTASALAAVQALLAVPGVDIAAIVHHLARRGQT